VAGYGRPPSGGVPAPPTPSPAAPSAPEPPPPPPASNRRLVIGLIAILVAVILVLIAVVLFALLGSGSSDAPADDTPTEQVEANG